MNNCINNIVDEKFINGFNKSSQKLMRNIYYNTYKLYCQSRGQKHISYELFFSNMRRRKIKLVQTCCPYCGEISIRISEQSIKDINTNCCFSCGKKSALYDLELSLGPFATTRIIINKGISELKKDDDPNIEIASIGAYNTEIVQLTTIMETLLRQYFDSILYIRNNRKFNTYVRDSIRSKYKNGFMNIEKAQNEYKRAFNINLKAVLNCDNMWKDLQDLSALRNVIVHNNGYCDNVFTSSNTYSRLQKNIKDELVITDDAMILRFFRSVLTLVSEVCEIFETEFEACKYDIISQYYFFNER